MIPGFPSLHNFLRNLGSLISERTNVRSSIVDARRGYHRIAELDVHRRVSPSRGLKDAFTTNQRTGWSCRRGVISPHNSQGASKLLINQNRCFHKRRPCPYSRALGGRHVLIIARGWPLFTPFDIPLGSLRSFVVLPPLPLPPVLRAKIFAKPMSMRCFLIADQYTRPITNQYASQVFGGLV